MPVTEMYDLSGQRFGLLTAKLQLTTYEWVCYCDCGNVRIAKTAKLRNQSVTSCGCDHAEKYRNAKIRHGKSREKNGVYAVWQNMKTRCAARSGVHWPKYGARGITVCDRWLNSFDNFYADMGERPPGLTLDRKNNDKGYSPDNCRWATPSEQCYNRRAWGKNS